MGRRPLTQEDLQVPVEGRRGWDRSWLRNSATTPPSHRERMPFIHLFSGEKLSLPDSGLDAGVTVGNRRQGTAHRAPRPRGERAAKKEIQKGIYEFTNPGQVTEGTHRGMAG